MKRIAVGLIFILAICLAGCGEPHSPYNIVFRNATSAGSANYAFSVAFLEDKAVKEQFADILITSDQPELELEISEENGKTFYIFLKENGEEYSLSKLLAEASGKELEFISLEKPINRTYILKSNKRALLKFRAVRGRLKDNIFQERLNASKEFELEIKKV